MGKKVLMISYLYPPIEGMAPRRMCTIANVLVKKNFEVTVLTCNPPDSHPKNKINKKLLNLISDKQKVFRCYPGLFAHMITNYHLIETQSGGGAKLNSWIKSKIGRFAKVFLVPDAKIDWAFFGINAILEKLEVECYNIIISHGYPMTSHLMAYYIKSKYLRKAIWIADYGEPWSMNYEHNSLPLWRRRFEYWLEKKCLHMADQIIVTTAKTKIEYLKSFSFINTQKVSFIPSCFIQSKDYENIAVGREYNAEMIIVYTGNFYDGLQTPINFFDSITLLNHLKIKVIIAGEIEEKYKKYIRLKRLDKKIIFLGFQNKENVIKLQLGSDILLLLGALHSVQVPSKIYEYIAAQKPIVCIKFDEDDVASKMILELNRGVVVRNEISNIKETLEYCYQLWQIKQLHSKFNMEKLYQYTQESVTKEIEDLFEQL